MSEVVTIRPFGLVGSPDDCTGRAYRVDLDGVEIGAVYQSLRPWERPYNGPRFVPSTMTPCWRSTKHLGGTAFATRGDAVDALLEAHARTRSEGDRP